MRYALIETIEQTTSQVLLFDNHKEAVSKAKEIADTNGYTDGYSEEDRTMPQSNRTADWWEDSNARCSVCVFDLTTQTITTQEKTPDDTAAH